MPACKRCNDHKGDHDVEREAIVNPTLEDPNFHLAYKDYRFVAITQIGTNTVDTLYLNDTHRLVYARFQIGEGIKTKLMTLRETFSRFMANGSTRTRNIVVGGIRDLLRLAGPTSEYAAISATVLINEEDYLAVKADLEQASLWDTSLQALEDEARNIAFQRR